MKIALLLADMEFAPMAVSFIIMKLLTAAAFGSPLLLVLKVCCWPKVLV
jgi:hypothetical protein